MIVGKNNILSKSAQFQLERMLRRKILSCPREDREKVVDEAYRELFENFPNHPRLTKTAEEAKHDGKMNAGLIRY